MLRSLLRPLWYRSSAPVVSQQFRQFHHTSISFKFSHRHNGCKLYQQRRGKKNDSKVSSLFKPVPVESNRDDIDIGAELTGKLDKSELLKILNKFTQKPEIRALCVENGLDS